MAEELKDGNFFGRIISLKEKRKLKALKENKRSEWFGFGLFGMVGWSVVVPTFLGAVGGIWLDKNYPESFSWTITGLSLGIGIGCFIAWNWIVNEH
jgi:ATP synthase protein I